jgi:hypothetical protein
MEDALPIALFFATMMLAIMVKPMQRWMEQRERREARALYERLMNEKLDIVKTAVAIGMSNADLADLDMRLERLIGTDQMQSMLLAEKPRTPLQEGLSTADIEGRDSRSRRRAERE